MIQGGAGCLVPYGGDPWKLEPPDLAALAEAGRRVLSDQPSYRAAARRRAVEAFDLEQMVDRYLHILLG
jgi:glycosyltransferase involved in cell wall biosynthesis